MLTKLDAYPHYGQHLGYLPIVCTFMLQKVL